MLISRFGGGRAPPASPSPIFPVAATPTGRYLVSAQSGVPFPILGRTAWALISLSQAAQRSFIDDTVARGYNTIEVAIPHRWANANQAPFANNGAYLPFSLQTSGSAYSGSDSERADFTTPVEAYWTFADGLLDYAASKGALVAVFPAYNGFNGGNGVTPQGWMQDMVANGTTKMQTYGQWIGNRWAQKANLLWMLAGDYGSGAWPYIGSEASIQDAFVAGLTGVTKQSNLFSAELGPDSTKATTSSGQAAAINANGAYSFDGAVATIGRTMYSNSNGPTFLLEEPYDEEGSDGTNLNPSATQPVRRFQWRGWLSAIAGYVSGNGYVWPFASGYSSHLNTTGTQDMARLNAFIRSIEWWRLVPDGLGGIGTLVTANGGTIDTDGHVTAAATSLGDLLVAYLGPSSGNPTIDMTKMRGTVTARWFDPTNGTYQNVSGQPFANTGTRTFTDPGNNSAGEGDWVLRLDA